MSCNRQALLDYAADQMDLDLISEFADHLATCSYCSSELLRIKRAGNAAAYRRRPPSAEVKPFVPSPDREENLVEYLRDHPDPEVKEVRVSEPEPDRRQCETIELPDETSESLELLPEVPIDEIPESLRDGDFANEPEIEPLLELRDTWPFDPPNPPAIITVPDEPAIEEETMQITDQAVEHLLEREIEDLDNEINEAVDRLSDLRSRKAGVEEDLAAIKRAGQVMARFGTKKSTVTPIAPPGRVPGHPKRADHILAALGPDEELAMAVIHERIGDKTVSVDVTYQAALKMVERGLLQRRKIGLRTVLWKRVPVAEAKTA